MSPGKSLEATSSRMRRRNSLTRRPNGGLPNAKNGRTRSIVRWLCKSLSPVRAASAAPTVILPTAGGPTMRTSVGGRATEASGACLSALDLQYPLHAVELALPAVAPSFDHGFDRRGKDLAGEELAELLDRAPEISRVAKGDAVSDVEAGLLAHVVHVVRELASKALGLELRRCLGHQRRDRARVAADRVSRGALVTDEHLARHEREALDFDVAVPLRVAALGQRLANARQVLAELR